MFAKLIAAAAFAALASGAALAGPGDGSGSGGAITQNSLTSNGVTLNSLSNNGIGINGSAGTAAVAVERGAQGMRVIAIEWPNAQTPGAN